MQKNEQKRKANHVVIVTSDAEDASVKQFRFGPRTLQIIILVLCIIIGVLCGCFIYEGQIWQAANSRLTVAKDQNTVLLERIEELNREKKTLESNIEELNEKVEILSATVKEKTESEAAMAQQLEAQSIPSEFPLTGSASMEETTEEDDPMILFKATEGIMVVSTAKGSITAVNEDVDYGHSVWVDHGNGYITIYKNKGDVLVSEGDIVVQGSALFLIGEDNETLGYQMKKDGQYINPIEVLAING